MHSIEIPSKQQIIEIPSDWDECSPDQVEFILEHAFEVMAGSLSLADFRIKIFSKLTGLKFGLMYFLRNRLGFNHAVNERIFQLSQELCNWIFVENEDEHLELQYNTITNFFPVLLENYYGPDQLISDMTLMEFKNSITLLDQYYDAKDQEEEAELLLNYFIATIYRPKNERGERRSLHNYIIEPEIFTKVPTWKKQVIAIWFSFCIKCLQEEDLDIYGIDVNLSILFPQTATSSNNTQKVKLGWTGVLMDIAESGVFGDATSTGQTLLYDVLLFLLKKHQDQPKTP